MSLWLSLANRLVLEYVQIELKKQDAGELIMCACTCMIPRLFELPGDIHVHVTGNEDGNPLGLGLVAEDKPEFSCTCTHNARNCRSEISTSLGTRLDPIIKLHVHNVHVYVL